jgi:hypothetical protein
MAASIGPTKGHRVSPGILFYQINAGGQTVKRMLTHL